MATEKEDLLNQPILQPTRSYDTDGVILHVQEEEQEEQQIEDNPLVETLDALDDIETITELLPPAVRTIIKDIVQVLSKDTQGKIIKEIEDKYKPEDTTPSTPKGPHVEPEEEPSTKYTLSPLKEPKTTVSPKINIFSVDPGINIKVAPIQSLYSLASAAYIKDDCDIKKEYASRMTDIVQKFYHTMVAVADDAGVPDYSYLMMDFDGPAVVVSDPNQAHLKDTVVRSQIVRDQLERQYKKTHSAEQALVLQRAWLAAARQRERYMQEEYKSSIL